MTPEEHAEAEAAYDQARAEFTDALESLADALDRHAGESLEWSAATFEASAETWPSDTPLFPKGVGEVLHDLAHPTPLAEQDGPPWTHHFPARGDWEDGILTRIVNSDRAADRPIARSRWAPAECTCPWPWPLGDRHAYVDCPHYAAMPPAPAAPFLEGCHQTDGTWIHGRDAAGKHTCPIYLRRR